MHARLSHATLLLTGALWLLCASSAHAQDAGDEAAGFDARRFNPTPGPWGVFATEMSQIPDHLQFAVRLFGDYANRPLVHEAESGERVAIIQHSGAMILTGALGLYDWVELGVTFPFVFLNAGEFEGEALASVGLGDPHVLTKVRILRNDQYEGFGLAAGLDLSIPLGDEADFLGDGQVTGRLYVAPDVLLGPVLLSANLGVLFRDTDTTRNFSNDHLFDLRLAVEWRAIEDTLSVALETFGSVPLSARAADPIQRPFEWLLGARLATSDDLHLTLAAGSGLGEGVGAPSLRVVAGFEYALKTADTDGDLILNPDDACRDAREDIDGFEDDDGCPDPDNDEDGLADGLDACPLDPEDLDGYQDDDGCPDPDSDGDGVHDGVDLCRDQLEDLDGFEDGDGCPDPDNDDDGLLDADDACVNLAEDLDGFEDDDGCPDPDNDADALCDPHLAPEALDGVSCLGVDQCPDAPEDLDAFEDDDGCPDLDDDVDGVPDARDLCPDARETINGVTDDDGCPDEGEGLVRLDDDALTLLEPLTFEDDVSLTDASRALLDQVALTLLAAPHLTRLRVEVHTDGSEKPEQDQTLSDLRADALLDHLVAAGVAPERLEVVGLRSSTPGPSGRPEARVEWIVLQIE